MTDTLSKNSILDPDLNATLQVLKADIFRNLNCVKPGQIVSFNPTRKTAEVQILLRRVLPDRTVARYPLLVDVPVFILSGGGAFLHFPISPGDQCLVLFSDRNIDAWFETGAENAPLNARAHDLSDAFALVGVNPLTSAQPAVSADQILLKSGTAQVYVQKDGTGAGVQEGNTVVGVATGKVQIVNNTTDLLTLVEGLIDVLKALTSQDPVSGPIPLTAASIAALEAQKAQFAGLLV